ncbi:hypothetical protein IQ254_22710 [Nodosilinea sp. LEGE 07088]|uniref:hypothetical protein n=1 Tax=Nodosilinea sp. LEGE 07088 TaxID=2777968 RepID=UPI0018804A10|nr:hypothetical protein [Nodosilinea sp. LEGE 07088]MBE9139972.1 hypothetical protein [Nodosilinea sp. LEGE 07088]
MLTPGRPEPMPSGHTIRKGFWVVESAQLSPQHVALERLEQQRELRSDRRVTMIYSTAG